MARTLHRPYLLTSLAFVSLGATLGLLMLAVLTGWHHTRAWSSHVVAHAQFQAVGFLTLFTLGMALQLLAPGPVPPRASLGSLTLLALGTVVASGAGFVPALATPGAALQLLGLGWHARLFWAGQRWRGCNLGFFAAGQVWLAAALATGRLDLLLWGFACLYITGTGFRLHPRMMACRRPPEGLQAAVLLGWNAGLATGEAWLLTAAAIVASLAWLHARRALWLRVLYANLALSTLLPAALARHGLATGFVLPMVIGMALELVPAFARRPVPRRLRAGMVGALLAATVVRVGGQATGWSTLYLVGGCGQLLILMAFVGILLVLLIQRPPNRISVTHES